MSGTEFELSGHTFRAGKLAPKPAWHVMRRLAPVIGGLADLVPALQQAATTDLDTLSAVLAPLADAIAKMSDQDSDYVVDTCLCVVQLRLDGDRGWAPIMAGKGLMFDWITMPIMIQLVWRVLSANLSDFFPAGASAS